VGEELPAASLGGEIENGKTSNEIEDARRAAKAFGRMGGLANSKKQSHEFYVRIGKKGGEKVRAAFAEKARSHHKKNDNNDNNEGKNEGVSPISNEYNKESVE
jgi:general stress protein YciG